MNSLRIVEVPAERLIDLRHRILRQGLPREEAMFPGDELANSLHVAAMRGDEVVGCATFHLNQWEGEPAYQLRGMATCDSVRRQGAGRAMLKFAETVLIARGQIRQLWCNARVNAIPFYESLGWTAVSEVFEVPTAGPHRKMTKRL